MPRNGAWFLSDWPTARMVEIECQACGRCGRYRPELLVQRYGDIGLPDLLGRLAGECRPKAEEMSRRCGARFLWVPDHNRSPKGRDPTI